ncbi:MAG: PIN domain-containing protein [Polyangia bacterium]|jgi:predicted nucleic acid-binding protein
MIIADTGFWLALANRSDRHHAAAVRALAESRERLVTTWPVLTETCHLLLTRLGVAAEIGFVRSLRDGSSAVFSPAEIHLARMEELMEQYADLPMDLADASLVVLAEELHDGRIFSTDQRDFRAYRWKTRKPFVNLLLG